MRLATEGWRRWAGAMALLIAVTAPPFGFDPGHVFTIAGTHVLSTGATGAQVSAYASEHRIVLGIDLLGECVLALALIGLGVALRGLSRATAPTSPLVATGLIAAAISGGLVLITAGVGAAIVELSAQTDYSSIQTLWLLSGGIRTVEPIPVAVFMATTGVLIIRERALPLWSGWFSLLVAGLLILEGLNVAVAAWSPGWPFKGGLPAESAVWAFVVSLVLLVDRGRRQAGRQAR